MFCAYQVNWSEAHLQIKFTLYQLTSFNDKQYLKTFFPNKSLSF